ncbi:hypothetical protein M2427_001433 [Bradyrhizobium sp. BR13661]|jgi:hypothetical protein|nr:hypothetical protein [Bradyrhizobium sp. BR13661]
MDAEILQQAPGSPHRAADVRPGGRRRALRRSRSPCGAGYPLGTEAMARPQLTLSSQTDSPALKKDEAFSYHAIGGGVRFMVSHQLFLPSCVRHRGSLFGEIEDSWLLQSIRVPGLTSRSVKTHGSNEIQTIERGPAFVQSPIEVIGRQRCGHRMRALDAWLAVGKECAGALAAMAITGLPSRWKQAR